MAVYLSTVLGSPCLGVYALATDKIVIVPKLVPVHKAQQLSEWLKVKLVHTMVCGSVIIGAFAYANSNGVLLPHIVEEKEVQAIESAFEGNVTVMETKKTAYGNLILANDKGAIVDPRFKPEEIRQISEALGIEAVPGEIAGLPYVGSLGLATNKGVLVHPMVKDSEKKLLQDVLKVPVDLGTVNCGIPYVGTGLIGNRRAIIAGSMTTGPETFIIENAFDVVKEDEEIESLQSNR